MKFMAQSHVVRTAPPGSVPAPCYQGSGRPALLMNIRYLQPHACFISNMFFSQGYSSSTACCRALVFVLSCWKSVPVSAKSLYSLTRNGSATASTSYASFPSGQSRRSSRPNVALASTAMDLLVSSTVAAPGDYVLVMTYTLQLMITDVWR
jgi:hypothetical protein